MKDDFQLNSRMTAGQARADSLWRHQDFDAPDRYDYLKGAFSEAPVEPQEASKPVKRVVRFVVRTRIRMKWRKNAKKFRRPLDIRLARSHIRVTKQPMAKARKEPEMTNNEATKVLNSARQELYVKAVQDQIDNGSHVKYAMFKASGGNFPILRDKTRYFYQGGSFYPTDLRKAEVGTTAPQGIKHTTNAAPNAAVMEHYSNRLFGRV